jgi:quercetin dioxygenase-like cupin family protein
MIYVLQGKMTFYYGDEQYLVEEGDCLNFNPTVPHKVVAADAKQTVKILSVLSL